MTSPRRRVFICLLALFSVLGWTSTTGAAEPSDSGKPKLLVLVVFDQLRGDYLERWQELYGKDGFQRLEKDGAWFTNCHYSYAVTKTAPGHACLTTGALPQQHGIIGNEWFDRAADDLRYCTDSERYTQVPPPKLKKDGDKKKAPEGISPELMLSPTIGESLKKADGKSRVVSLSLKDRSAVLMGGAHPDGCYWFDSATGSFVTSTYYRDALPTWVETYNKERPADGWYGKAWTPLQPKIDYRKYCTPKGVKPKEDDDEPWPFKRSIPALTKEPGPTFYKIMYVAPFGNEMLLQMAKRAIAGEQLGQRDSTDLLCVSFSCNDGVGHIWGPDSPEVVDVTLRSDLIVKELLELLDAKVGKGKYMLALSADHGICPLPEVSQAQGRPADRLSPLLLSSDADAFLRKKFGKEDDKGRWVLGKADPWVYLNRQLIQDRGLDQAKVEDALANWYAEQTGILKAYTRTQFLKGIPADDTVGQSLRQSFHPDRAGDVGVLVKPYYYFASPLLLNTTHGTPYFYDTHVPLLVMGPGIRQGTYPELVTPQAAVTIFAKSAGIAPPRDAAAPYPKSLK